MQYYLSVCLSVCFLCHCFLLLSNSSPESSCLDNEPLTTKSPPPQSPPLIGQFYSLNEQCRLLFGENSIACNKTVRKHVLIYLYLTIIYRTAPFFGALLVSLVLVHSTHLQLGDHPVYYLITPRGSVTMVTVEYMKRLVVRLTVDGASGVTGDTAPVLVDAVYNQDTDTVPHHCM